MDDINAQIVARRAALDDRQVPPGSDHKWGLALSGGGIRSATFCFGVLRALAHEKLLLRFDLLSTVSGGGYIGSMLGRLFDRATSRADLLHIQQAIGEGDAKWFTWWLRANGRYLIPRGAKDRTFAVALFLRNLVGVHFELGLIALLLGLALAGIDILGWWALDSAAYSGRHLFDMVRWLPAWLPVLWLALPLVALAGAVCAAAYWVLPWLSQASWVKTTWAAVLVASALLAALFASFGQNDVDIGDSLRLTLWWVCAGLLFTWLLAVPVAALFLRRTNHAQGALRMDAARSLLTKALAKVFRVFAVVAIIGAVDRVAWYLAFERAQLVGVGLWLGIAAAVLRAVLPLAANITSARKAPGGLLGLVHLTGYLLTFALCAWWVSLVHKAVLGAMFTDRALVSANGVQVLLLLAAPILAYLLITGRNLAFLNLSSLHPFYRARLVRSYLGAANGSRFEQAGPLGALNTVPATLPTATGASVEDVHKDDDKPLDAYRPQRAGGPLHLINVCVNQTKDPRGHLFNQDRRGLPLTVASGGLMQVSQEGWKPLRDPGSLSLGSWVAISGAAVAPGLGALTRGGISALATYAGMRLGYWWSQAERTNGTAGQSSTWLAKSRGILSETLGVFKGTEGPDWFLTDGGHFENTGAYALLAERAEFIVLADCGADPEYAFGDIENLVRKARIDLQADIHFLKPKSKELPKAHAPSELEERYHVAKPPPPAPWPDELGPFGSLNDLASPTSSACLALARVVYRGDRPGRGLLIVIKPNLCAGLPVDLVNFKAQNPEFPQQTTADQFFSEAQWESYFQLGQFLGGHLSHSFIAGLLHDPGAFFVDDDCSPLEAQKPRGPAKEAAKSEEATAPPSRLPSRIGATAVGTTLGLGAAATLGVSAWQAIDSVRSSYAKQTADERAALKELTDLWAKLPTRPGASAAPASAANSYGSLAAALVRTADTLCPHDEATWFVRSPLAGRIFLDAVDGCRNLPREQRTQACTVLIEAKNPALKGSLPNCLAVEDAAIIQSIPPPRYWGYDYTLQARWVEMHPCDPQRAELVREEDAQEAAYGPMSNRQSSQQRVDDVAPSYTSRKCAGAMLPSSGGVPVAPPGSTELPSLQPPQPADSSASATAAWNGAASAAPASVPVAAAASAVALPVPASAPASATAAGSVPASSQASPSALPPLVAATGSATATSPDAACKGITVYMQIYDSGQRDGARAYRDRWKAIGANVPPIEDVVDSARRAGRLPPTPLSKTTVRYHDDASIPCAESLGPAVGAKDWVIEPLSVRLKPTRRTLEAWISPRAKDK